ncbi:MAG: hypothetical protein JNJ49_08815 [Bdellovibrionaceae bacterium]|nr:hypothetical protein [Pseudobdellovibrionaceae bacterium]
MMKSVKAIGTSTVLAGLILGCSSQPKAVEPKVGSATEGALPASGGRHTDEPSVKKEGKATETAPVGVVDSKHAALSLALRSGKTQAVNDEAARVLVTHPDDVITLNALAMWNYKQGKIGAAKLLLARAIEKGEPSAAVLNNYGLMLYAEGDELAAAEQYKKAIRLDERHAEANANLGSHYARGGDWKKALPRLETAWKAGRIDSAIANNYALALKAEGESEKARRIFEEAAQRNNKDPLLLLNYAALLIETLNRPKEGLPLVYRVKFLETDKKEILTRANQLERRASQSGNP